MKAEPKTTSLPPEDLEAEYSLVERRLADRRRASPYAPFPPGLRTDRRWSDDRRADDADAEQTTCGPQRMN